MNSIVIPMGERVLSFADIDAAHGRTNGTAGCNFRVNKKRFIEGVDYYKIQSDEIHLVGTKSPNDDILVTERGYYLLAKSFDDNLSWDVQQRLINSYLKAKPNYR